jgi:hypothetical protein
VFNFEHTGPGNIPHHWPTLRSLFPNHSGGTVSKSDKAMEYAHYAQHCLRIVDKIPDQESRMIHREMAAEWFNLADLAARGAIMTGAPATGTAKAGRGQNADRR